MNRPLEAETVTIQVGSGWRAIEWREIWRYRELLYVLSWRDIKVRYRQTFLGILWVTIQPILNMLVYTLLFNRVARFQSGAVPYALFVLLGLLPWGFFAAAVQNAGNSLVGSSHLISKVYFPRLIIPMASVLASLVDLFVGGLLVFPLMLWYGVRVPASVFALPLVVLVAMALASGIAFWVSALSAEYRDLRVLLPFLLQLWMFGTPVVYPLDVLPDAVKPAVLLNPLTGVVGAFRASLLGSEWPVGALLWSVFVGATVFVSGALYFRRMERAFADVL